MSTRTKPKYDHRWGRTITFTKPKYGERNTLSTGIMLETVSKSGDFTQTLHAYDCANPADTMIKSRGWYTGTVNPSTFKMANE